MMRLPLNKSTLPALASGADGEVVLDARRDGISTMPLSDLIAPGGPHQFDLRFDLPSHDRIPLGSSAADLHVESDVTPKLLIVSKDSVIEEDILSRHGIERPGARHVLLVLETFGQAGLGAAADFPAGPFEFGLLAEAGGHVRFTHIRTFDRRTSARVALETFLHSTRLPHDVSEPEHVPAPGDVLAFEYGGYLSIGLSSAWGFTMTRYAGADLGKLAPTGKVDVTSSLHLRGGVKLAGDFAVEVRRGLSDGWARVTVRKRRERAFTFSGGLDVGIELETDGLPADADQFLEAALDMRTPQILQDLRDLIGQGEAAFFAHVRERKNALLEKLLDDLSQRWFERALSSDSAGQVFERLQDLIAMYDDLDDRARALLEWLVEVKAKAGEHLDDIVVDVEGALAAIAEAVNSEALKILDSPLVWDILRKYAGDAWIDVLTSDARFEEVREAIVSLRERPWKEFAAFVHARYESTGLKAILDDLRSLVDRLREVEDPEKALQQAEKHLLTAAERITDHAFDALAGADLHEAIRDLDTMLDEIDAFKRRIYAEFSETINRSHKIAVARTITRARASDALMDVEFDLASERGRALMHDAVRGKFDNVLDAGNAAVVRIHRAAFTHRTTTTHQLKLDLFGWTRTSFRSLIIETEKTIRREGDDLLHFYTLSADEDVTRKAKGEEFKLRFILNVMASGVRADVVDTVSKMSARYAVGVDDRRTTDRELLRYLTLGGELGILPHPPDELLASLKEELSERLPDEDWGRVTLTYDVRWPADGLTRIVEIPRNQMLFSARETLARIVGGAFLSCYREGEEHSLIGRGSMWHYRVGRLLLDRRARDALRTKDASFYRSDASYCRVIEGEELCIGGRNDRLSKPCFQTFFSAEERIERALLLIHERLKSNAGDLAGLENAVAVLAEQRKMLARAMPREGRDRFTEPFFAILDQLIMLIAGREATRSVLELTVHGTETEPPAPITKMYA